MTTRSTVALLLAATVGVLHAQGAPEAAAAAQPAFTLDIRAPKEVSEVLERHLELQRYREQDDLEDSELARLLPSARQNTQELLATLGYFSPVIRLEQAAADTSGGGERRLILEVDPGSPTLVGDVHLDFSGPIATDPAAQAQRARILAAWPLRAGMRFTQAAWDAAKLQVLRELTKARYPTGEVDASRAEIDTDTHSARLSLTLASGPAYTLGAMSVSGLAHHDAETVTRLARLPPGERYDQTRMLEAQQRLSDSGFFDSVYMTLDTTGDPGAATVLVKVREAKLKKLVLGVGASTDTGLRLSAEHTHHKLPGIGWKAVSKLLLDREKKSLGTEMIAPPDAGNWRWLASALVEREQSGSFEVDSVHLRTGRSQSGDRVERAYYLQYERARNAGVDAPESANALSANHVWTHRDYDNLIFPTRGHGLGLELGGGLTLGGEREPFGRADARWLGYFPFGQRSGRIAARAEFGAVVAREEANLPTTQLFLTGGDNSVRGYAYRSLGVTLPDGQTAAGRYLAVGSVEWQRPIVIDGRMSDWETTLFVDAGDVANKPSELRANVGVGVGARWKSPVGPLQVDLAWGVETRSARLHLSMGLTF